MTSAPARSIAWLRGAYILALLATTVLVCSGLGLHLQSEFGKGSRGGILAPEDWKFLAFFVEHGDRVRSVTPYLLGAIGALAAVAAIGLSRVRRGPVSLLPLAASLGAAWTIASSGGPVPLQMTGIGSALLSFGLLGWAYALASQSPLARRVAPAAVIGGTLSACLRWAGTIVVSSAVLSALEVIVRHAGLPGRYDWGMLCAAVAVGSGVGVLFGAALAVGFVSLTLCAAGLRWATSRAGDSSAGALLLLWPLAQSLLLWTLLVPLPLWSARSEMASFGLTSQMLAASGFALCALWGLSTLAFAANALDTGETGQGTLSAFWCGAVKSPLQALRRGVGAQGGATPVRGASNPWPIVAVCCGLFVFWAHLTYHRFMDYSRDYHLSTSLMMVVMWTGAVTLAVRGRERTAARSRPWRRGATAVAVLVCGATATAALTAYDTRADVAFMLLEKTEVVRSETRLLWRLLDRDGDGHAALLGGGDPDDADSAALPIAGPRNAPAPPLPFPPKPSRAGVRSDLAARRPLLFIVTVETFRADCSGLYGDGESATPRMDAFGRANVVFQTAYASSSSTRPSLAHVATGKYSSRFLLKRQPLPLLESLAAAGYDHVYVEPFYKGIIETSLGALPKHPRIQALESWRSRPLMESLLSAIDDHPDPSSGVCALLHLNGPHFPYRPAEEEPATDDFERYRQCLAEVDRAWQFLVDGLRERGLYDDAVILLTSDHGEEFWDHGKIYHGVAMYQETMRVPFFLKVPGITPASIQRPVASVDILPSIAELLDFPMRSDLDGRSFAGALTSPAAASETPPIFFISAQADAYGVLLDHRWKFLFNRDLNTRELYDLEADPDEVHNVVGQEAMRAAQMGALLDRFIENGEGRYADPHPFRED